MRRHYREEIPAFASQFEFIDLLDLPMTEIRKRVSALPDDTAIIYTSVTFDGAGVTYVPHQGLAAFANVANRPIVIDVETNIGYGGVGGLVTTPVPVGEASARIALRILDGEEASKIPVTTGDFTRPIFDWRELQRFGISENRLPAGSEIRFRQLGLWDQYRWELSAIFAVVLTQGLLIGGLLFERRRRHAAELELRRRLLEVIHLNRTATAGALSASIAHELNQPLGAIHSYAEAAELYLKADPPNIARVEEILPTYAGTISAPRRSSAHFRGLLKKTDAVELQEFDLNDVVRSAVHILDPEAFKARRGAQHPPGPGCPAGTRRSGSPAAGHPESRGERHGCHAELASGTRQNIDPNRIVEESEVEVLVADSGTGIPDRQTERNFQYVLHDQAPGHRTWLVHCAHDRRDLWRQDMGGKSPRGRRGVSFYPAADQGGRRMTSAQPTIHVVDDDASFRAAIGDLLSACGYRLCSTNWPSNC